MMKKTKYFILAAVFANLSINIYAYGVEREVVVGFHKVPGNTERAFLERRQGRVKKVYKNIHAVSLKIDKSEVAALLDNPDVAYVEKDVQIQAINPVVDTSSVNQLVTGNVEYDNAWSVSLIGAETAHSQSVTGLGVNIAILDTGIDYNHPDLDQNYSGGDNFVTLDVNNHDPMDDSFNGHGTHVAGIVAAELDGAGVVGVSPNASIYAVKILDGAGFGSVSTIVAGIDWAISNQMDIVNMSVGISAYSQVLADACAAAEAAGILLVAAAGNTYGGQVLYPAAFPSVIAVGATTIFGEISPISPIGPELEIVAPGLNVYSTISGDGYSFLGGTSQAAPHVSGLAALLLSAGMVTDIDGDGVINNRDTRLQLQDSVVDLGVVGFDEVYGHGLVDVAGAFSGTGENPITHLTVEKNKGSPGKSVQTAAIENGVYDVTIVNTSLRAMKMLVVEGEYFRRDLSENFKFMGRKRCSDEDDGFPQEVSFSLDASETSYTLVFLPKGRIHTLADIYIQQRN